jgi:hypothetical protein
MLLLLILSSLLSVFFFNSDIYPFIHDIFSFVATLPPYIWLIVTSIICCYAITFAFSLLFIPNMKLINTKAIINPTEIFSGGAVRKKTYSDSSSKSSQKYNGAFPFTPQLSKGTVVGCRPEVGSEVIGRSESEKGSEGVLVKRGNIKTDDYHSKITGFSNPSKETSISDNNGRFFANVGELKEVEEMDIGQEQQELVTYNICCTCQIKEKIT